MSARQNAPRRRRRNNMTTSSRAGPSTATTTATQTITTATPHENNQPPVLRLQLSRRTRVRWTEDTHDNEHDGKKSSKSCCIFHKSRAWDESSTESDSSCEADADRNGAQIEEDGDGDDGAFESDGSSSSGGPVRRRAPKPPKRHDNAQSAN